MSITIGPKTSIPTYAIDPIDAPLKKIWYNSTIEQLMLQARLRDAILDLDFENGSIGNPPTPVAGEVWTLDPSNPLDIFQVDNAQAYEGTKSLAMGMALGGGPVPHGVTCDFTVPGQLISGYIDMQIYVNCNAITRRLSFGDGIKTGILFIIGVSTLDLYCYDGVIQRNSGLTLNINAWNHIIVIPDFVNKTWTILLNDEIAFDGISFYDTIPTYFTEFTYSQQAVTVGGMSWIDATFIGDSGVVMLG